MCLSILNYDSLRISRYSGKMFLDIKEIIPAEPVHCLGFSTFKGGLLQINEILELLGS